MKGKGLQKEIGSPSPYSSTIHSMASVQEVPYSLNSDIHTENEYPQNLMEIQNLKHSTRVFLDRLQNIATPLQKCSYCEQTCNKISS